MPTRFGVERKPNVCGCRQVVRHELPKLAFAGSNPVTRSIDNYGSLMAAVFVARLSIQGGPHESEQSHIRHVHLRS